MSTYQHALSDGVPGGLDPKTFTRLLFLGKFADLFRAAGSRLASEAKQGSIHIDAASLEREIAGKLFRAAHDPSTQTDDRIKTALESLPSERRTDIESRIIDYTASLFTLLGIRVADWTRHYQEQTEDGMSMLELTLHTLTEAGWAEEVLGIIGNGK